MNALTEPEANDVSCVQHSAMPRVRRVELFWGSDIEQEIPQGCLECVEGKVEEIERYYSKANCCILYLKDECRDSAGR